LNFINNFLPTYSGFTINRVCWAVGKGIKLAKIRHPLAKWIPTVTGLLSIPFIIHPIDKAVDVLMDETYRKYVL
jgi:mitochondrial fission process protein 1